MAIPLPCLRAAVPALISQKGEKNERAKNDEKIAALRSRNRELDESIVELENTDIIGLARATGMSMEELAQFLTQLKRGGAPFITPNTKEDMDYVHEEE